MNIQSRTLQGRICPGALDFQELDCVLSDIFFSITSPEPYRVIARTWERARALEQAVRIKSVYDIR